MSRSMDAAFLGLAFILILTTGCANGRANTQSDTGSTARLTAESTSGYTSQSGADSDIYSGDSLLVFTAKERGMDSIDLSDAAMLEVSVDSCLEGQPIQYITDPDTISSAVEALLEIRVTGLADTVGSTGDSESYSFRNDEDKVIAVFTFQDGLLLGNDGRYSIEGEETLYSIPGIKHSDDWKAYREDLDEKESEYEDGFHIAYPTTVFALGGYVPDLINKDIGPDGIVSVAVSAHDYDIERYTSSKKSEIEAIYSALCDMKVTGESSQEESGQDWYVTLYYEPSGENFYSSTYLKFNGDCLVSEVAKGYDTAYTVTGIDKLFDVSDAEVFQYLRENRMNP